MFSVTKVHPLVPVIFNSYGYKDLANAFLEEGRNNEIQMLVKEIFTAAHDAAGSFQPNKSVYEPSFFKRNFKRKDFILERYQLSKDVHCPLLEDNRFSEGFYINLSHRNAGYVYIPGKKTFQETINKTEKEFILPLWFVNALKIIQHCAAGNNGYICNDEETEDGKMPRETRALGVYLRTVRNMLYSGNGDSTQNVEKQLIRKSMNLVFPGKYKKVMASPLVPRGCIWIPCKKTRESFSVKTSDGNYHVCAMRTPLLWRNQARFVYQIVNIVDNNLDQDLAKDYYFFNPFDLALLNQSDCDGDGIGLFSTSVSLMEQIIDFAKNTTTSKYEESFHNNYLKGEFKANDKFDKLLKPYNTYITKAENYYNYLLSASKAKADIGVATYQLWSIHMFIELYKNKKEIFSENQFIEEFVEMNSDDFDFLINLSEFIVQNLVIRGIKHNDNGSNTFEYFKFDNINNRKAANSVAKIMIEDFDMDKIKTIKALKFILMLNQSALFTKAQQFVSAFNSGKINGEPIEEFNLHEYVEFVDYTTFGSMFEDLYQMTVKKSKTVEDIFGGFSSSETPKTEDVDYSQYI